MRIIAVVFFSAMLSGCLITSPYKSLSTEKVMVTNVCGLSEELKKINVPYSCLFTQSIKESGSVSQYLLLSKVNNADFNSALNGTKFTPQGLQSVALPSNVSSNINFLVIKARDGFGWSTDDSISISGFTPSENKNYIAKVEFLDTYKFNVWIEESDTGNVVAGKRD